MPTLKIPKQPTKAIAYANKVVALTETSTDPKKKLAAGMAHSTIGYAYLKQDKLTSAVGELKTAAGNITK